MRKHLTAATAAFALAAATLTGCSSASSSTASVASDCKPVVDGVTTIEKGKLTMAIAEYPPYVSLAGGSLSGVDGAVLSRVAARLCLSPDPKTQSFTAIIESVKSGSADLSAGNWYINDERKSQFQVSDPVYIDQMVVVSKDNLSSLDQLKGKTVGTTQGYLWVGDFQAALGTDNVHLYASEDATYQDIRNGRVQAGIFTYGAAQHLLKANKDNTLKIEVFKSAGAIKASVNTPQTAVLINQGNTKLLEAVNKVVTEMRADGSLKKALTNNGLNPSAADIPSGGAKTTAASSSVTTTTTTTG